MKLGSQPQPQLVAQICNLLYRRFAACWPLEFCSRSADYKSAIQQIKNLRYASCRVLPISILILELVWDFGFRISDFYHG
jgi:hypothetical protein